MKKTIVAFLVLMETLSVKADPLGTGCQTVFDFNTGKYTKVCCTPDGRCTVFTF